MQSWKHLSKHPGCICSTSHATPGLVQDQGPCTPYSRNRTIAHYCSTCCFDWGILCCRHARQALTTLLPLATNQHTHTHNHTHPSFVAAALPHGVLQHTRIEPRKGQHGATRQRDTLQRQETVTAKRMAQTSKEGSITATWIPHATGKQMPTF